MNNIINYNNLFFSSLFILCNKITKNSGYSNLLFSLISSILSTYNIFYYNEVNTNILIDIGVIYFIIDIFYTEKIYIIHHLLCLYFSYNAKYNLTNNMIMNYITQMEISSIFLGIKYLKFFKKDSILDSLNNAFFCISFFIFRTIYGTLNIYNLLDFINVETINYYNYIVLNTSFILFICLQLFWTYKIIKKIIL